MLERFDNRPEDFYIDATIEYQDRTTGEYWEDENVPYEDINDYINDRGDENLEVVNITYYLNDMCGGNDDYTTELWDEGEAYALYQLLEKERK